jgi:hypothetical protein
VPVEKPVLPGLRPEVAPGGRLLVRQQDRVVLLGRQRIRHQGVYYIRTGHYRSPLPSLTAAKARQIRSVSTEAEWAARWAHRFVDLLRTAVASE